MSVDLSTTTTPTTITTTEGTIPPAYEDYRKAGQPIGLSPDAKRLKWTLEGPLHSAIEVMHGTQYEADVPTEPYGTPTTSSSTPTWHPISLSPLTDPKVSSVTVHIELVEDWEDQWLEFHRSCHDPDEGDADPDEFLFGKLPDYDPEEDEDEEEGGHLLRCCRGDRPRKKAETLHVRATATGTGAFLTIHDYVSKVHPWLLTRRDDILGAEGDLMANEPLPADTRLLVGNGLPDFVNFETEAGWKKSMSRDPLGVVVGGGDTEFRSVFERSSEWPEFLRNFRDGFKGAIPL